MGFEVYNVIGDNSVGIFRTEDQAQEVRSLRERTVGEEYSVRQVKEDAPLRVISLGAGVQSTAMLLMSLRGKLLRADCAIFADTQWEPKAVYAQLERLKLECEKHNFPLHIVTAGNLREDVLRHYREKTLDRYNWTGQPPLTVVDHDSGTPPRKNKLWRQCTKKYKLDPIREKIRNLMGVTYRFRVKGKVEQWIGITTDEAHRMKDSGLKWLTNVYPLIYDQNMDRKDCLAWLKTNWDMPVVKSCCLACPFQSKAQWRDAKVNRPEEFQNAVDFDNELRKHGKFPLVKGENSKVYVYPRGIPLEDADFSSKEDSGQLALFGDFGEECEGMCGL